MSGVWLDKELNAKIGFCPPSMAYSTTVPTGNPFHAPKLPIVDRTPVLHVQYIFVHYFSSLGIMKALCNRFQPVPMEDHTSELVEKELM